MQPTPRRIQAIEAELDRAAEEYTGAKDTFQEAQVAYETAREKLAGVKALATEMMPPNDWFKWQSENLGVTYLGMSLGDAIIAVLQNHAYTQAQLHVPFDLITAYRPSMPKDSIVEVLEAGGFDFRTTTPLREISAALLRLDGVEEQSDGEFVLTVADQILERVKAMQATEGSLEAQ